MGIVPILRAREIISILQKAGFKVIRQRGSHIKMMNKITNQFVTVPFHNKDVPRPTLMSIIKQAGLTVKDFLKLLSK